MQGSCIRYNTVEPRPSRNRQRDERLDDGTRRSIIEKNLAACSITCYVVTSFVEGNTQEKPTACRISVTPLMQGPKISSKKAPKSAITHLDKGLALYKRMRTEEILAACTISGQIATSYPSKVSASSPGMKREPQDLKSFTFAPIHGFRYRDVFQFGNIVRQKARYKVGYLSFKSL